MKLSRRALMFAAAAASRTVGAADLPGLLCPLTAEPTVLVPGVSNAPATRLVGAQIYRGLMRWGPDGGLEPDLATAVELSADALTYTIQLRPGVVWHDSGGFTSADVAFSLGRFHQALQPGLQLGRLTVDTPGPLAVVLTLPEPDRQLLTRLTALSLPIVPLHVHDRAGWALDPKTTTPVGTGPFRMEGWLRLVRFAWYVGPKPSLAAIDYPVLPDATACTALVGAAGPVLLVGDAVDWPALPHLRALPAVSVGGEYPPSSLRIAGLQLNDAVHPLDEAEVRSALARAIDPEAVLKAGWAGLGRVAATGPGEAGTLPGYSPRIAADHLRTAGLRPDSNGIRARLTCLHPPGPAWRPMLDAVRRSLAQVGIELVAEALTQVVWERRMAARAYELSVFAADAAATQAPDGATRLPMVEPALPVVAPAGLRLPRGVLGSFEGAGLD